MEIYLDVATLDMVPSNVKDKNNISLRVSLFSSSFL